MKPELLSIVLPVHNQMDHAERVIRGYLAALGQTGLVFELILVPNGCRDDSPAICERLSREHPGIRVVTVERAGWGRAVRAGLGSAKGDLYCYTNLARTTPETLVLLVLYAVSNPGVVVKANRKVRESLLRRLGSVIYNFECRMFFDLGSWDINGTPKVFSKKHARLCSLSRDDDLIDLEFAILCRREKYPLIEVPIMTNERFGGKTTTGFGTAFRLYAGAWRMWRSLREVSG